MFDQRKESMEKMSEFDRVVMEQQQRANISQSAPSDTSAILRELTSPSPHQPSVDAKIKELTFAERKDAKKVLVSAL